MAIREEHFPISRKSRENRVTKIDRRCRDDNLRMSGSRYVGKRQFHLFRMRMTERRAGLIEISEAENLFVFGTDEANADVEDSGYVRATF